MKLHLGCGKRFLPGFVHIDIADFSHVDFVSGIDDLSHIEDNKVSEIYSSHSFEYFDRFEAAQVLEEWNRVLIPGGALFITVPDFNSLISIYQSTGDLNAIVGPLFGRWENGGEYIYHKTTWDFLTLSRILRATGFEEIASFDPVIYLEEIDPNYDDYSLAFFPHNDRAGIQVSLAIRAIKQK